MPNLKLSTFTDKNIVNEIKFIDYKKTVLN